MIHRDPHAATWLTFAGTLNSASAPQLTDASSDAWEEARLIVLDLRLLNSVDDCGAAAIARLHERAQRESRRMVLIRAPRQRGQFEGLDRLFTWLELGDDLLSMSGLPPGGAELEG